MLRHIQRVVKPKRKLFAKAVDELKPFSFTRQKALFWAVEMVLN